MPSSPVSPGITDADQAGPALTAECRVFCRYLAGVTPDEYIQSWYRRGHAAIPYRLTGALDRFDRVLVRFARLGAAAARMADAYARRFRSCGVLRQKLVLLLAILEHAPGSGLTRGWSRGRAAFWVVVVWSGVASGAALLFGVVLLGPVHLLLAGRPAGPEAAE